MQQQYLLSANNEADDDDELHLKDGLQMRTRQVMIP